MSSTESDVNRFWDQVATAEVLACSQPPASFPTVPDTRTSIELQKSKAQVGSNVIIGRLIDIS